ncbi:CoA ester lyase [Altererythrobacter sp. BO-6]|uniref:HpcH/HpaI aldolase/citrate lyase family protein n=1 Tax=Altererythrobacter sp. BO-6 TaxID=2604537 RepID=UPI0013E1210E|nr:CoA ester lyase [Altererythrobacter sp. BO-6]QIG54739.1 CoA ester lyase [Altererythrobacter sp. BO-6]
MTRLRSLLFVPGDSDRKFAKGRESGADVLICDLEDAVAPSQKEAARVRVSEWLGEADDIAPALFVRINPLDTGLTAADLAAVVRPGLAGIVLPKANGAQDVTTISDLIAPLERVADMTEGTVKILVVATETPAAMFALGSYAPAHPRLLGLTWGAEDLGAAIGITSNKEADGSWTFPFQVARAHCLFAAANAEVAPIDTLYADFTDDAGLESDCRKARRDGFTGRIAIHPAQVETINRCFTPSEEELAEARKITAAFAANPDAGTLGIDGKMYDIPHLVTARKVLAAAGEK